MRSRPSTSSDLKSPQVVWIYLVPCLHGKDNAVRDPVAGEKKTETSDILKDEDDEWSIGGDVMHRHHVVRPNVMLLKNILFQFF